MILYKRFQEGGVTPEQDPSILDAVQRGWNTVKDMGWKGWGEYALKSAYPTPLPIVNQLFWGGQEIFDEDQSAQNTPVTSGIGAIFDAASVMEYPYRWGAGLRSDQPYSTQDVVEGTMPTDVDDNIVESLLYDPTSYVGWGIAKKLGMKAAPKLANKVQSYVPKFVNKLPKNSLETAAVTGGTAAAVLAK